MFDLDKWSEIYATIKKHKLRTALTAFGVFWGIFMLIVLLGAGKGLENGVIGMFSIAKNAVFIWSQRTSKEYMGLKAGRFIRFTNEDVKAIREQVPEVGSIAPGASLDGGFTVNYKNKSASYTVQGEFPELRALKPCTVPSGRFINDIDMNERRKVALIGTTVKEEMFGEEDPIGKYIRIKGVYFKIVGTFKMTGNPEYVQHHARLIIVPCTTLQQAFNLGNRVNFIAVMPKPGIAAATIETKVKELLAKRHKIAPGDEKALGSANVEKEFIQIQGLFTGIAGFSWFVAVLTIVAGIIGVSNIMLIVVKERTKEIGIRKALGATPGAIVSLIVQESIVITSMAGYVGLLLGLLLVESASGLEAGFFAHPEVDIKVAVSAVILLITAGALAGIFPASKAASINPIVALRDE